jgi:hypothetical protein
MTAKTRIAVVVALLIGAGAVLLVLNLTWLVAILAGGALLVGIPGFVAGTPRLRLEVRNDQSGTATLTRDTSSSSLTVWLVNDGRGAAESIEVTMDAGSPRVYNESGNSADPSVLDQTVHPMRWHDHSRRVGPHDEIAIAKLHYGPDDGRPESITWTARARDMKLRQGIEALEIL